MFRSVYIVQNAIIPINKLPLESNENIRKAYKKVFNSKACFTDMRTSIYDYYRVMGDRHLEYWNPTDEKIYDSDAKPNPLKDSPFIRNMGQVCFDTRRTHFTEYAYERRNLAQLLARRVRYWDAEAEEFSMDIMDTEYENYFGYDYELEDQRMNYLFFELRPPFKLKAGFEDKIMADGKVFVHLHPSGYLSLQLAVSLKNVELLENVQYVKRAVLESRPWRNDNRWIWKSRLGNHSLQNCMDLILLNISESVFNNKVKLTVSNWKTAMCFVTDEDYADVVPYFINGQYEVFSNHTPISCYQVSEDREKLIASNQGIIYFYNMYRERDSVLHAFWKAVHIYEFVLLKKAIYNSYSQYIDEQIYTLRRNRLKQQPGSQIEESYNPIINEYIRALDKIISKAGPFHRAIYSTLSKGTNFDDLRTKLMALLDNWHKELLEIKQFKSAGEVKNIINYIIGDQYNNFANVEAMGRNATTIINK